MFTLALATEPLVDDILSRVQQQAAPPSTSELLAFDRFSRIFCTCGRHTYGDLQPAAFTRDVYTCSYNNALIEDEAFHAWWFNVWQGALQRWQQCHDKHKGRTSAPCLACDCSQGGDPVHLRHHQVLDLTRPLPASPADDQYALPAEKPLWQGAAYCKHLLRFMIDTEEAYLIERTDGLWILVQTYDCSATPDYRCFNHTAVHWTPSFEHLWHHVLTQLGRQCLWRALTAGQPNRVEPHQIPFYDMKREKSDE